MDRDILGEALHTALRKCCDSNPTSIAWNAIELMGKEWEEYLNCLINTNFSDKKSLIKNIKEKSLKFKYFGNSFKTILHCSFELFDDADWDGYCSYLMGGELDGMERNSL